MPSKNICNNIFEQYFNSTNLLKSEIHAKISQKMYNEENNKIKKYARTSGMFSKIWNI